MLRNRLGLPVKRSMLGGSSRSLCWSLMMVVLLITMDQTGLLKQFSKQLCLFVQVVMGLIQSHGFHVACILVVLRIVCNQGINLISQTLKGVVHAFSLMMTTDLLRLQGLRKERHIALLRNTTHAMSIFASLASLFPLLNLADVGFLFNTSLSFENSTSFIVQALPSLGNSCVELLKPDLSMSLSVDSLALRFVLVDDAADFIRSDYKRKMIGSFNDTLAFDLAVNRKTNQCQTKVS